MRLADADKALLHADPRYQAIRAAEKHAPTIHPDDLARIQSGELKGWRQKPWGQE